MEDKTIYCEIKKKNVEITLIQGLKTCSDSLPTDGCCQEYNCSYHNVISMARFLTGAAYKDNLSDSYEARNKKPCDICSNQTPCEDSFLLQTKTVLASDKYLDFVIRGWVKDGKLPSGFISAGITNQMRKVARKDIDLQAGGTPWVVCGSCIHMFLSREKDMTKAKGFAKKFWGGAKVKGF